MEDSKVLELSGAQSTKRARVLSELYPSLRFIVQIAGRDPTDYDAGRSLAPRPASSPETLQAEANHPRISVQTRTLGPGQPVLGAAAYILHLPSAFPAHEAAFRASIAKDLQVYTGVLAANPGAMLIVTARLLPPPGAADRDLKAMGLVRDLTLLHLANKREEEVAEFVDLVSQMGDSVGRLVVVDRLCAGNNLTVALAVK